MCVYVCICVCVSLVSSHCFPLMCPLSNTKHTNCVQVSPYTQKSLVLSMKRSSCCLLPCDQLFLPVNSYLSALSRWSTEPPCACSLPAHTAHMHVPGYNSPSCLNDPWLLFFPWSNCYWQPKLVLLSWREQSKMLVEVPGSISLLFVCTSPRKEWGSGSVLAHSHSNLLMLLWDFTLAFFGLQKSTQLTDK